MNWLQRKLFKVKTGTEIVDLGRADEVVIRYKDKIISVLEAPDGEIKSLGWFYDTELHTPTLIRDFWTAHPPTKDLPLDIKGEPDGTL